MGSLKKSPGKAKKKLNKFFKALKDFFIIKEEEKERLNLKNIGYVALVFALVIIMTLVMRTLLQDTSAVEQTDSEISIPSNETDYREESSDMIKAHLNGSKSEQKKSRRKKRTRRYKVDPRKYKASQVIKREDSFEPTKTIPMGTNLIGKLLTSIDTREAEQLYKVFLPYGGNFKGGAEIPKGSTLYGKIRYPGKGRKVFLSFNKGVYPTGEEFEIQAQALSSKDYSPGVRGDFHGQSGSRVAATLGLAVVSGASAILAERQQAGLSPGNTGVSPRVRASLYGGLSETAQNEAQRRAQGLSEKAEYVTVDAGKDLIVNLTGAYIKK